MKMSQAIGKSEIVRALSELPEDATLDDAFQRLFVLHKIEQGLKEAELGKTTTQADVESEFRLKRTTSAKQ